MNRFEKALNLNNEINKNIDDEKEREVEIENINKFLNTDIILKSSSSETVQTSIRVKKELMDKLYSVSERTGRSRNYIINYLLENYLSEK